MDIELLNEDCLVALKKLPANSLDSVCTDPPSGIALLGHQWDNFDSEEVVGLKIAKETRKAFTEFIGAVFTEVYRVLKPGAFGLVWALPRTSAWTATGLEDAGFKIVEVITHLFATGWVKHKNGLKPSSEHWILIRKESEGSLAENLWNHGVGELQVDACRVDVAEGIRGRRASNTLFSHSDGCVKLGTKQIQGQKTTERPPDKVSPTGWGQQRQEGLIQYPTDENGMETVEDWKCAVGCAVNALEHSKPGASRFFPQLEVDAPFVYEAKASIEEKQAGTHSLYWKKTVKGYKAISFVEWVQIGEDERKLQKEPEKMESTRGQGNLHPTVKSLALVSWLIKLVTPSGGTTLDCFLGSGTTACAALLGGFKCVGIEKDPTYFVISQARLDYTRTRMETLKRLPKQQDLALGPPPTTEKSQDNQGLPGLNLSADRVSRLIRRASKKTR
jgi:site-specific DNA-methyltransferase (adenine-specific)